MVEVHVFQTSDAQGKSIELSLNFHGMNACAHSIDQRETLLEEFSKRSDGKPLVFITSACDSRRAISGASIDVTQNRIGEFFVRAAKKLPVPTLTIVYSGMFADGIEPIQELAVEDHAVICMEKNDFAIDGPQIRQAIEDFAKRFEMV